MLPIYQSTTYKYSSAKELAALFGTPERPTAAVCMDDALAIGLTVGGNILVGRYFGSGADEDRKKAAGNTLTVGAIAGILFTAVILLFGRPFLVLLKAPAMEDSVAYLSICGVGLLFIFGYNALSAILRGVGNSRIPLYCVIASVSLNVVLDIYFVAVKQMGVQGAALATVIGQAVSFAAALVSLEHRWGAVRAAMRDRREWLGLTAAGILCVLAGVWILR